METPRQDSLKGQFLMAMPGLTDPNFTQSVTLICEHSSSGAMGVIIDRTIPTLAAGDIFRELEIPCQPDATAIPIHYGGPVHVDEIFVLHTFPFDWDGCLMVTSSIALSNTLDLLAAIADGNGPESYLIFIGCAGWGEGQLEAELRQNAWLTCPGNEEIVFEVPASERWETALNRMGVDPALLSSLPGHA